MLDTSIFNAKCFLWWFIWYISINILELVHLSVRLMVFSNHSTFRNTDILCTLYVHVWRSLQLYALHLLSQYCILGTWSCWTLNESVHYKMPQSDLRTIIYPTQQSYQVLMIPYFFGSGNVRSTIASARCRAFVGIPFVVIKAYFYSFLFSFGLVWPSLKWMRHDKS